MQLFADLPGRLNRNLKKKNPDNDMNYLYLKKVKYRNIFDQMNKEVLSSQGFFSLANGTGEGVGRHNHLDT